MGLTATFLRGFGLAAAVFAGAFRTAFTTFLAGCATSSAAAFGSLWGVLRGLKLEAMREGTPRGGTRWHRSSVKQLLAKAERLRLGSIQPQKLHCGTKRLLGRMNKGK